MSCIILSKQEGRNVIIKATGLIRKIDDLGRVVIPAEVRRNMGISERDPIEIYIEFDKIILKKYEPRCTFCGSTADLKSYQGKIICQNCVKRVFEIVNDHVAEV